MMPQIFLNEILRSVHGMFKEEGCSVGFERNLEGDEYLILDT